MSGCRGATGGNALPDPHPLDVGTPGCAADGSASERRRVYSETIPDEDAAGDHRERTQATARLEAPTGQISQRFECARAALQG